MSLFESLFAAGGVEGADSFDRIVNATSDRDDEVSIDTLKKKEIDKIMQAVSRGKEVANDYYRNTIEPAIKKREDVYRADHDHYKTKFPGLSEDTMWCSKDVQSTINWIMPSLMEAFTGGDDPVDIKGVGPEDDLKATKAQKLLKYQLERKNRYFTLMHAVLMMALKTNFGVAKAYWLREDERDEYKVLLNKNDTELIGKIGELLAAEEIEVKTVKPIKDTTDMYELVFDRIRVVKNYPVVDYMPASEFRFTPDGSTIADCKFVAHRKIVKGDYLKRKEREGVYQNVDEAIKKVGNVERTEYERLCNKELMNSAKGRLSDDDIASKEIELYECYLQVDYNNDGIYENLIVHCVDDVPLRISLNDFEVHPFFVASSIVDPHLIFSEDSFADILEQLQDLKTALVKQIIINVAKNNAPQMFFDNRSIADLDALYSGEEYVPVNGEPTRALYIPPAPQVSGISFNLIEFVQNELESQSGSTRYNQGLDSNSLNKTATGLVSIMGAADKRTRLIGKLIADNFVIPLHKFLLVLNQKYLEPRQLFRLDSADEVVDISRDELDIDYDFIVNVGQGAGTKEAQIQYLMVLINQIYPILQAQGIVNEQSWFNISKEILNKMGLRNTESYLFDPKSPAYAERKKMQMSEQQQMQQMAMQLQQYKMKLDETKLQVELEKAKVPRISGNIRDIPPEAQAEYLNKMVGVQTTPDAIVEKEILHNAGY